MSDMIPLPMTFAQNTTPAAPDSIFEINPTAGPELRGTAPHAPAHHAPVHHAPVHHATSSSHAALVCPPPAQAAANSSVAPVVVHAPPPGQHVEITVSANQPLNFDFNPLDAKAVRHGDDLTLTFADGGVVVLHHITDHGTPLVTQLELPDGTVINPCELLQAFPEEQVSPAAGNDKIPEMKAPEINPSAGPEEINPAAGPTPILAGAPPVTTPFDVAGLGNGLTPLGPLGPEGFGSNVIFPPPGNGGFPPPPGSPPGSPPPNNPPPPPGPHSLTVFEDSNSGIVDPPNHDLTSFSHIANSGITGNFITDTINGHQVVTSTPAASVTSFHFGAPGSPVVAAGGSITGNFGTLTVNANGSYVYHTDVSTNPVLNQLGSDFLSQALTQSVTQPPGTAFYYPVSDTYDVTVTNGTDTATAPLVMYVHGADVITTTATIGAIAGAGTQVLLTYTDLYNPAHSFETIATADGLGHLITTDGSPIQPGDLANVSIEHINGTGPVTINSLTIAGETVTFGAPITLSDAGNDHAFTSLINPIITPGDVGSATAAHASTDTNFSYFATAAGEYVYGENSAINLGVVAGSAADNTGTILNLGTVNAGVVGHEFGGLGSDVLVWNAGTTPTYYNGTAGVLIGGTATNGDSLSIIVSNASLVGGHETVTVGITAGETTAQMAQALATAFNADANLTGIGLSANYGGGSGFQYVEAAGSLSYGHTNYFEYASTPGVSPSESISAQNGIDTLRVDAAGQSINLNDAHLANIDTVNLGNGGGNSLTLTADDVFRLAQNENSTIKSFSGADSNGNPITSLWITGDGSNTVHLNADAGGSFTEISNPINSGLQTTGLGPSSPTTAPTSVDGATVTSTTTGTQMVGFTEFSGVTSNGNTVHVYVENAIANSSTPHHVQVA